MSVILVSVIILVVSVIWILLVVLVFMLFQWSVVHIGLVLPTVILVLMVLIVPVISKGREMLVVLVGIVVQFICFVGVSFWLGVLIIMVVVVFFGEIMLWASFICLRGTALVPWTASPGSLPFLAIIVLPWLISSIVVGVGSWPTKFVITTTIS